MGSMLRGLGTGRTHKQWGPPSQRQFGSLEAPSPLNPSRHQPGGTGVLGAQPGQVLTRWGGALGGRQSHTLIAERSPCLGAPRGCGRGSGDVCTRAHTRACIRAHTCTHSRARASTGTLACTQPTHVAPSRGSDGGGPAALGRKAAGSALSRAQARRRWRRSCPWWARRCPRGSTGPRCPGTSWS